MTYVAQNYAFMLSFNVCSRIDVGRSHAPSALHLGEKKSVLLYRKLCRSQSQSGCFEEEDISCRCCFTYSEVTRGARCNGLEYKLNVYPVIVHETSKL